ncbi:MAG: fumarylacetoacetate hydrolase family protein [Candidatus Geothermarchaeota archaeon]
MTLTQDDLFRIAEALYEAQQMRNPIDPITEIYPNITVEEAYKIQLINIDKRTRQGQKIIGKKIGLTSKSMQKLFGVNEPDYGHLTDTMYVDDHGFMRLSELIQPRIEAEIAFILKDNLKGPGVTVVDVLRAVEGVVPALEVIDSRIKNWKIKIQDTIADNASAAKFVIGNKISKITDTDLRTVGMIFEVNGDIVATASGAAVLGNPLIAIAWLANKLAQYNTYLKAGEIILSGSLIAAVEIRPGDYVRATFDRLGDVSVKFVT